jgi:hypothetical protein
VRRLAQVEQIRRFEHGGNLGESGEAANHIYWEALAVGSGLR